MSDDTTIEQLMAELETKLAWFQSEDFRLEEAQQRFTELRQLAQTIDERLNHLQQQIDVMAEESAQ